MDRAYSYSAKNSRGQLLQGVIYAKNKPLAFARLKRGGFRPLGLKFSLGETLSGILKPGFKPKELARFYNTVGRRMQNGKPMADGLESAIDYVNDQRLRQAIMMMRQLIVDGTPEHVAMLHAGFPRRDCLSVKSVSEAGKSAESFLSLASEIQRVDTLKRSLNALWRMPKIMSVFMVGFTWASIVFMAPMTLSFLKQTGLKMHFSPFLQNYFDFVRMFNGGLPRNVGVTAVSSLIYFGSFAAVAAYVHSTAFKKLLDRFSTLRTLSIKSDHAALWSSFVLLYEAAIPAKEASTIVGDAANRLDSKRSFHKMGRLLEAGHDLASAASQAGFPPAVLSGVKAAVSSGAVTKGLEEMATNLEEDVRDTTLTLKDTVQLGSVVVMGLGVLVMFVLTYYPMMASVMSNL